jgi:putative PIN family toxin of toxin-antitoxin system
VKATWRACSMKSKADCIVIDTNVLISAGLLPQSRSAQVLALAVGHFAIAQNNATWHELETRITKKKLDRYFGDDGRSRHLLKIAQSIEWFDIASEVTVSRDPTDDKFVGLAVDSGAKLIISGDRDLTEIRTDGAIEIISPTMFFERMHLRGY